MRRRGFTLLEVSAAAALGSLVLLAAVGIFAGLDRSDRNLQRRFDDSVQMARVQVVVQRALMALVMDEVDTTAQTSQGEPPTPDTSWMTDPTKPRPRFHMGSSGPNDPQRFELLVSRTPIAPVMGGPAPAETIADPARESEPGSAVDSTVAHAFRGAFELHPAKPTDADYPTIAIPGSGWTLWWVPVRPPDATSPRLDNGMDPDAVPLATDLAKCSWTVYDDGERKPSLTAMDLMGLPAYVELEIRTNSGVYQNWMFEILYRVGDDPEHPEPDTPDDQANPANPDPDAGNTDEFVPAIGETPEPDRKTPAKKNPAKQPAKRPNQQPAKKPNPSPRTSRPMRGSRAARRRPAPARRRGFVLPLVMLLSVAGALMVTVMLERTTAQRLAVRRQLDWYRHEHLERGIREIINQWLPSLRGENPATLFGADGRAFDLKLENGIILRVFMRDGQGSMLANLTGLSPDLAADAQGALALLRPARPEWLRQSGPLTVSLVSSPDEILSAIARYASEDRAPEIIRAVDELRERTDLSDKALNDAIAALELEDGESMRLQRLLTARPEIYRCEVHILAGTASTRPSQRYRGLLQFTANRSAAKAGQGAASFEPLASFLEWERLDDELDTP